MPAGLHNGMVAPLAGSTTHAILGYQGENDATAADTANTTGYRFSSRQ